MKRIVLLVIIGCSCMVQAGSDVTYMQDCIGSYRGSASAEHRVLRLVYFHPNDVEPQAGYEERIGRIMKDIQDFYRSEMKRNGFGELTFPLEMVEGKPRIHRVLGSKPSSKYNYKSGRKVAAEIKKALEGDFDMSREFVLIFNGMCQKREDGSYFFHAPYYGQGSSNQYGLCHVADCELLDTQLLAKTERRFVYEEHSGKFEQNLALFNVKYIGGVAHELGHALNLPHNGETSQQKRDLGTALMGAGNHTYRKEHLGGKGSFLTMATATRLASHPLFLHNDKGLEAEKKCDPGPLKFAADNLELTIEGNIDASPPVYAVIAYLDPEGKSDYNALSFVADVRQGKFEIHAKCANSGDQKLKLVACHVSGAMSTFHKANFNAGETNEQIVKALASK